MADPKVLRAEFWDKHAGNHDSEFLIDLDALLKAYMEECRWAGAKAVAPHGAKYYVVDAIDSCMEELLDA